MSAREEGRDRRWIDRARALARRGWGRVHPNPMVGCVLVRNGEVVGEGWHDRHGGPHAEVEALRRAGEQARNATAYVSLEPCAHHGKTPPCTEALVKAGVRRVVYGSPDPTAEARGGAEELRRVGVEVTGPLLDRRVAWSDNPAFHRAAAGRGPWVALKLATSLDGAIAARPGCRSRVTGTLARERVHALRRGFDAILVGSRTARVDDPLLTVRTGEPPIAPPRRVVLDTRARLSPDAALLGRGDGERGGEVWIGVGEGAPEARVRRLRASGARVLRLPEGEGGLDLGALFARLEREGVRSVLCEGGGILASALVREARVHRLYLFLAPLGFAEEGVQAFPGEEPWKLTGWRVAWTESLEGDGLVVWDAPPPSEGEMGRDGTPRHNG